LTLSCTQSTDENEAVQWRVPLLTTLTSVVPAPRPSSYDWARRRPTKDAVLASFLRIRCVPGLRSDAYGEGEGDSARSVAAARSKREVDRVEPYAAR
jgi:hypothetical protein